MVAVIAGSTAYLGAWQASAFIRQDFAGTALVLADRLNRTLSIRYADVRSFARLEPLQPLWQSQGGALRDVLEQLQSSYPDFSWIGFARPDGTVAAATGGMLESASVEARPWFTMRCVVRRSKTCMRSQLLARLLDPKPSGEPFRFVDIAFPVYDTEGRIIGVLCAHPELGIRERAATVDARRQSIRRAAPSS